MSAASEQYTFFVSIFFKKLVYNFLKKKPLRKIADYGNLLMVGL